MKGREVNDFQREIAELPLEERIDRIRELDFSGIYIDRRAYTPDDLKELEEKLEQLTGSKMYMSDNGNLSYFDIK